LSAFANHYFSATLGTLASLIIAAVTLREAQVGAAGHILLDLAGAIYAGDNAFVCSMGWMRIRLAENEVQAPVEII
jgi:hypothetical protein